jgi:hypothetical protein
MTSTTGSATEKLRGRTFHMFVDGALPTRKGHMPIAEIDVIIDVGIWNIRAIERD